MHCQGVTLSLQQSCEAAVKLKQENAQVTSDERELRICKWRFSGTQFPREGRKWGLWTRLRAKERLRGQSLSVHRRMWAAEEERLAGRPEKREKRWRTQRNQGGGGLHGAIQSLSWLWTSDGPRIGLCASLRSEALRSQGLQEKGGELRGGSYREAKRCLRPKGK